MPDQPQQTPAPSSESLPGNAAGWVEVDREVWDDGSHEYQARVVARSKPAPPPKPPTPRKVLRVGAGDIEVEPVASSVRAAASVGYAPRMVSLRRVSVGAVVAVLLAVWLGYAWGHSAGRAEMARDIVRAGVHRLADRPALVDTIEDASGWDADTREAERQRARDERGR